MKFEIRFRHNHREVHASVVKTDSTPLRYEVTVNDAHPPDTYPYTIIQVDRGRMVLPSNEEFFREVGEAIIRYHLDHSLPWHRPTPQKKG